MPLPDPHNVQCRATRHLPRHSCHSCPALGCWRTPSYSLFTNWAPPAPPRAFPSTTTIGSLLIRNAPDECGLNLCTNVIGRVIPVAHASTVRESLNKSSVVSRTVL